MKSEEEARRGNLGGNIGYLGFWGFLGFLYFGRHDAPWLLLFSLYGLFGGFFLNSLFTQKHDERYLQNSLRARSAALIAALSAIALIAVAVSVGCTSPELLLCVCAFGTAATAISYCAALWYYERR